MNHTSLTDNLKKEVSFILNRYEVPMDDKSLILDKIDESFSGIVQKLLDTLENERQGLREEVESFKENAKGTVVKVIERAKSATERSFQEGFEAAQATVHKPSFLQILLTIGLLLLAGFLVISNIFFRK